MTMHSRSRANQNISYPFIRETLLADEKLVFVTRPHWIVFGPCVAVFIVAFIIYTYGAMYFSFRFPFLGGYNFYQVLSCVAFLTGIYWLIQALIRYYTSEYGVTNKRVLMKTGWIRRNSLEIFLQKLEAIHVDQTVVGRLLNYGTIVIIGTGGTQDYYCFIPRPLSFRKRVQQQTDLLTDEKD